MCFRVFTPCLENQGWHVALNPMLAFFSKSNVGILLSLMSLRICLQVVTRNRVVSLMADRINHDLPFDEIGFQSQGRHIVLVVFPNFNIFTLQLLIKKTYPINFISSLLKVEVLDCDYQACLNNVIFDCDTIIEVANGASHSSFLLMLLREKCNLSSPSL